MSLGTSRRPRSVTAMATYLNAGLWGSRFIGDCEVSTNGERVWLTGPRVPAWVTWVRVLCYVAFIPMGFFSGVMVGQTVVGRWGYPPYYYLVSVLLTFLLVVIGLWGAGIWTNSLSSHEAVSWPASVGRCLMRTPGRGGTRGTKPWRLMNTFVTFTGHIQVEVPIGPGGKPRRLVLKARGTSAGPVLLVLSGVYYGQSAPQSTWVSDPWGWSRN